MVTVPVLAHEVEDETDATKIIHVHEDTYVENGGTTEFEVRYVLYRYDADGDKYVALEEGTDYTLKPYRMESDTYKDGYYAYGNYYAETKDGAERQYTGSRFQLTALTDGLKQSFMDGDLFYITATSVGPNGEGGMEEKAPESVKVQLVVPAAQAARPHDPENRRTTTAPADPAETLLEEGWIYGVNYGDYSVITVPTLAWEEDLEPDANGVYQKEDVTIYGDTMVRDDPETPEDEGEAAVFHIWYEGPDGPVELELGTDIDLAPVDEKDPKFEAGDPYNYDEYWSGTDPKTGTARNYTGAKFRLELLEPKKNDDGTAGSLSDAAQALADILDNQGSLDTEGRTSLYIQAEDKLGRRSQLVELVIRPYHSLEGTFVSYAPTHEAAFSLYAWESGDVMDPGSYSAEPLAVSTVSAEEGTDLWRQSFAVKSSELLPQDGDKATYKLVIEKAGHITYTRVALELEKADPDDTSGQRFTLYDEPRLIAGDITGRGKVKDQERALLVDYIMDSASWSQAEDETQDGWDISVYNPEAFAYACDLDGDGRIGDPDLRVLLDGTNFNKSANNYNGPDGKLPNGLGAPAEVMLLEGGLGPVEDEILPPEELVPPEEVGPPTDPEPPAVPDHPTEPDLPEGPSEPAEPEVPPVQPEEPGIIEPPLEPEPSAPPPEAPEAGEPEEDGESPPDADIDSPEPDEGEQV